MTQMMGTQVVLQLCDTLQQNHFWPMDTTEDSVALPSCSW